MWVLYELHNPSQGSVSFPVRPFGLPSSENIDSADGKPLGEFRHSLCEWVNISSPTKQRKYVVESAGFPDLAGRTRRLLFVFHRMDGKVLFEA